MAKSWQGGEKRSCVTSDHEERAKAHNRRRRFVPVQSVPLASPHFGAALCHLISFGILAFTIRAPRERSFYVDDGMRWNEDEIE